MNKTLILLFIGSILLSSCSETNENGGNQPKETVKEFIGIHPLKDDTGKFPMSIDSNYWEMDEEGKVIKFGKQVNTSTVEYSENQITITEPRNNMSGGPATHKMVVYLENNRVSKIETVFKYDEGDESEIDPPTTYLYSYDDEGYLERIYRGFGGQFKEDSLLATFTVENGNVVELIHTEFLQENTYKFTYDTKEYIPKSDWAPNTPLAVALPYYNFILLDGLTGKKNKNNIVRVDFEYGEHKLDTRFESMTYEPEFDDDGDISAIKHTGRYIRDYPGEPNPVIDFDNLKTQFLYRTTEL